MKKIDLRGKRASLGDIYSLRDDHAQGRLITLGSTLAVSFYNVFITGIFHTGFLSMYGISITGVGIITFIPFIANCFSIFSSKILGPIPRRKAVLVGSKIFFYALYNVGATLMPQFVIDPGARLTWFAIIMFVAHAVYALFNPGFTTWFYNFYPEDNERRTRFITYNQIFGSIMSSVVLLLSGILTDSVTDPARKNTLILTMRYIAFAMVLVDVAMQACAKEYSYPESPKSRLSDVFTLPFRYKKFLMCMLFMFYWNFVANLNNGLWNYHMLNHLHFSYTLINTMSLMYTIILIFIAPLWQRVLRRYSWIKTFGIANLFWFPTEIAAFFLTPGKTYLYVMIAVVQNVLSVGLNLSYANVLYMNLPEENSTTHIAFYTIGCNLFAFLGLITGTWISSFTGDSTIPLLGMQAYSVQFTTLARSALMLTLGLILTLKWRMFTPDHDIADIEHQAAVNAKMRAMRVHLPKPRLRLPHKR